MAHKHRAGMCVLGALALAWLTRASGPAGLPVDEAAVRANAAAIGPSAARTETEHYVIVSDGSTEWSRSTTSVLETTHDVFERFMSRLGIPGRAPEHKLMCVLIEDHERFAAFATAQDGVRSRWMGGYYATSANRVVFYNSLTAPDFKDAARDIERLGQAGADADGRAGRRAEGILAPAYRTISTRARADAASQRQKLEEQAAVASLAKTTHEAAHLIAFNCGLQSRVHQYPFWLSEGLATCFEAETVRAARRGQIGPEHDNAGRRKDLHEAIAQRAVIPLEAFICMNAVPEANDDAARVMYAQAWSLFQWLYRHEREELAAFFGDLASQPPGAVSAHRQGELFAARFGPIRSLEKQWLREIGERAVIADAPVEP